MGEVRLDVGAAFGHLRSAAEHALVGQEDVFELLCVALFSGGHVLLEGVPGTGKTLMANVLARLLSAEFRRIQFTPDLMPSDILGTSVFDLPTGRFHLRRGPIFAGVLLADEINRAPAKTQAALLEAMEERQVSLDGVSHTLPAPFFVVATQNPVEYEGTYPLPEAQLDRFLFKLAVDYPSHDAELGILERYHAGFRSRALDASGIKPVLDADGIAAIGREIETVTVERVIFDYILGLVEASRNAPDIALGASPRAALGLLAAGKTLAAARGRDYVTPDDVKHLAAPVFRHRLILKPEAEIEGLTPDRAVERLLARVPVPR